MAHIEGPRQRAQDQHSQNATGQQEAQARHRPGHRVRGMGRGVRGGAGPRAVDGEAIGMNGARDVLDVLFADILGAQHQLADDLFIN